MTTPAEILRYLADLAPRGGAASAGTLDVVASPRDFAWLGQYSLLSVELPPDPLAQPPATPLAWFVERYGAPPPEPEIRYAPPKRVPAEGVERLASVDALDPVDRRLRAGTWWVVGRRRTRGAVEPILFPVVTRPLVLHPRLGSFLQPEWTGDALIHPLLQEQMSEEEITATLAEHATTGDLADLVGRSGIARPEVHGTARNPLELVSVIERRFRHEPEVTYLVPGTAIYLVAAEAPTTVAAGLRRWAQDDVRSTAFGAIYGRDPVATPEPAVEEVEVSLPTNARQREAIRHSRTGAVSVVSGPPGTGQTHLVVAAAVDAIARGEAVLIATQSDHAADSVCELLERHPTPTYLRFGRAEHRQRVAEQLSAGRMRAPNEFEMNDAEEREARSRARRDEVRDHIRRALTLEQSLDTGLRHRDQLPMLTADAPGVLDVALDLDRVDRLLERAGHTSGFLGTFRARRSERDLRRLVGARAGADIDGIARAVELARAGRAVEEVLATGGVSLDALWDELADADARWRVDLAVLVDLRRRQSGRLKRRRARSSVAALANVLRSGVARRHALLAELESDDFLDLLPLWIGTLAEVERTLPAISSLFDLVILDEASQIDQMQAAGVLCRAERVMVVGDASNSVTCRFSPTIGSTSSSTRGASPIRPCAACSTSDATASSTWPRLRHRSRGSTSISGRYPT
ncbi:MAG: AAA domain-containing protein [Acidimicrobiales bacterium]